MAVAYDAVSAYPNNNGVGVAGNISWTHTPVGTPKGVVVYVVSSFGVGTATDEVTSVTYGGVSMTQATDSPSSNATGENGTVHAFYLESGIPTGAQTVAVTASGSTGVNSGYCITVTAGADTEFVDSDAIKGSGTNPTGTLVLGGVESFVSLAFYCGQASAGTVTENSGWSYRWEHDFGSMVGGCYSYNTVGTSNVTYGITQSTDDYNILAVGMKEGPLPPVITPQQRDYAPDNWQLFHNPR